MIIPVKSSEFIELLSRDSFFSKTSYFRHKDIPFISNCLKNSVITGNLTYTTVVNMINEFFHEDHLSTLRHVVLLSHLTPSNDFEILLKSPKFKNKLFFLTGKLRDEYSMTRSRMQEAEAIFLVPDKNARDHLHEDTQTVMTLFSIKKFLASKYWLEHQLSKTRICIQLLQNDLTNHVLLNISDRDKLIIIGRL